jgi:hypothetical protein
MDILVHVKNICSQKMVFFPQSMDVKYLHNLANFEFTKKSFFLTTMRLYVVTGHASSMLNELWVP